MRFPVVLFDLDGTLVDSAAAILGSFHHATETVPEQAFSGRADPRAGRRDEPRAPDGAARPRARRRARPRVPRAQRPAVLGARVLRRRRRRARAAEGEGRRLGVVTAKRRPTVERVFAGAGIGDFFDVVVGSDDTERHKPHPEPVLKALELLDARARRRRVRRRLSVRRRRRARGGRVRRRGRLGRHPSRVEDADAVVETPEELLAVL